jgi:hypothetical protein
MVSEGSGEEPYGIGSVFVVLWGLYDPYNLSNIMNTLIETRL